MSDLKRRLLGTKEAMEYLGIKSRQTFEKLINSNGVKNVSFDRFNRFDILDLDKLIEDQKKTG